jgi:hypothetical protein
MINDSTFLKDVARHQIELIRDDGVNRHIRFKRPDSFSFFFDLITWNGHLCFTGDCGTYVFSRVEDMFDFFRLEPHDWNFNKQGLSINPGYWSEKVLSIDRHGELEEYDAEKFERAIREYRMSYIRRWWTELGPEKRRELFDEITEEVINHLDEDESSDARLVYEYRFRWRKDRPYAIYADDDFTFVDFFERSFKRYSFRFMWCCYALAWGVKQYDTFKEQSK